jgi:hypothetical protein
MKFSAMCLATIGDWIFGWIVKGGISYLHLGQFGEFGAVGLSGGFRGFFVGVIVGECVMISWN